MNPTPISPPSSPVPPGACDCHVHVFWPARFPYDAQRKYTPPPADVPALRDLRDRLAFTRSVLVQPSCYGHDNAALVAALAELGPQAARGVCVVDPARVTDGELATLHQAGVRGLRLNAHVQGMDAGHLVTLCRQAAARVAGLGWHLQLHVSGPMLAAIQKVLCNLKVPVVLDHFGGGAPAADSVAELLAGGQIWLKLSAPYRVSTQPGYDDLAAAVQRYLRIAPQRLLWASDWPHTGGDSARTADIHQIEPFRAEDAGAALNRLARWVEDPAQLHAILVLNPAVLYGFEPATPSPLPAFH